MWCYMSWLHGFLYTVGTWPTLLCSHIVYLLSFIPTYCTLNGTIDLKCVTCERNDSPKQGFNLCNIRRLKHSVHYEFVPFKCPCSSVSKRVTYFLSMYLLMLCFCKHVWQYIYIYIGSNMSCHLTWTCLKRV